MGGFIRAKRFKFMSEVGMMDGNGSIEIKPTTQLILHPTTDLVASPEGSFIIRTTASFEGDVSVGGNLNVLGSIVLTGAMSLAGSNTFGDDPSDYHTFKGAILASGNISARGNASIEGDLWTKGNASVDGTLDVAGNTVLSGSAHIKNNASIDGDLDVSGNSNLQNASIEGRIEATGGNVLTRRKVSLTYSDFTAEASTESKKIFLGSTGDTIFDITAKLATPFKYDLGPATVLGSIYKVSVGDMSNLLGYNASTLCGSSVSTPSILFATQTGLGGKGLYLWNASGSRVPKVLTANASIHLNLNASGGTYLASLSQGIIHLYIDSIQNP